MGQKEGWVSPHSNPPSSPVSPERRKQEAKCHQELASSQGQDEPYAPLSDGMVPTPPLCSPRPPHALSPPFVSHHTRGQVQRGSLDVTFPGTGVVLAAPHRAPASTQAVRRCHEGTSCRGAEPSDVWRKYVTEDFGGCWGPRLSFGKGLMKGRVTPRPCPSHPGAPRPLLPGGWSRGHEGDFRERIDEEGRVDSIVQP